MKTMIQITWVGLVVTTLMEAGATKLYEVESGKVSYAVKGSGNVMGSRTKTTGTKTLIFDAYGAQNLREEDTVTTTSVMGTTQTTKNHTSVYMNDGVIYSVDHDQKQTMRMENMAAMMGGDMTSKGKVMMQQMGGKQRGYDKVLGYRCEVWELMGTKQCLYKGIPLKVESNMMGIKHTEIATKAKFDLSIPKSAFKLADFPMMNDSGEKISSARMAAMDSQSQKEAEQMQEGMAKMFGMMANASQEAGVKAGERPSAAQQAAMQQSMQNAMLPMMKQEFLSHEKSMRLARECLKDADTLKEANRCNEKLNQMTGEEEDPLTQWDAQTKKEALREINHYLDVILPCVKKAESADAMESCMQ